jgi:hypothetical protein
VALTPVGPKTGNYTAKPGDFVIVNASGASTITITYPAGAPTGSLVGVKLVTAGNPVTVQAAGSDVFDAQPPGTSQFELRNTGATVIAQYKAAVGTWYIQSVSYTETGIYTAPNATLPGTPDANTLLPADLAYVTWSYDPANLASPFTGTALTSGKIYLVMCPVRSTVSLTGGFTAWITSGGSGLTSAQNYTGIYSAAGTLLAGSADTTASFGSSGELDFFLTGSPAAYTASPPFVWAAFLSNGTTPPSLARTGNQTANWANGNLPTNIPRFGTLSGTYTSLPSSFGSAVPAPAAAEYWVGLY